MINAMLKDMQLIALREIAGYDEAERERRTDKTITVIEELAPELYSSYPGGPKIWGPMPWTEAAGDMRVLLTLPVWEYQGTQCLGMVLCDVWGVSLERLPPIVDCALCLRAFKEERYLLAWRILYTIISGTGIHAQKMLEDMEARWRNKAKGEILNEQKSASVNPRRDAARAEAKRIWEADPALKLTDCARQVRNHLEETRPHNSKAPYRSVSEQQVRNYIRDLCPSKR